MHCVVPCWLVDPIVHGLIFAGCGIGPIFCTGLLPALFFFPAIPAGIWHTPGVPPLSFAGCGVLALFFEPVYYQHYFFSFTIPGGNWHTLGVPLVRIDSPVQYITNTNNAACKDE